MVVTYDGSSLRAVKIPLLFKSVGSVLTFFNKKNFALLMPYLGIGVSLLVALSPQRPLNAG